MTYTPRTFDFPELDGLSKKQIEAHLALYEGYVKHVNLIVEKIAKLKQDDAEGNAYIINELRRRMSFEFDGMRMHEYYFEQFGGGKQKAQDASPLLDAATDKYGGFDGLVAHIKEVAGTRGIGWTILYYDPAGRTLHTVWVSDHEIGQLSGLPIILALDMWEHAFMVDYLPKEKSNYVDAFLKNLNWSVIEQRFLEAAT